MQRAILKHAPNYWDPNYETISRQIILSKSSNEEYEQIVYDVKNALRNQHVKIKSISRNQNIHDYGQVLLREQLLAVGNPYRQYYRVRRFITIKKQFLNNALIYNLDPRRCGKATLQFRKDISWSHDELVLVVWVITAEPSANCISPENSSNYFIDYIIEME